MTWLNPGLVGRADTLPATAGSDTRRSGWRGDGRLVLLCHKRDWGRPRAEMRAAAPAAEPTIFTRITVSRFLSSAGPNVTADGPNAGARHALPGRGACSARNTRRCGLLLQCDLSGQIARDLHARRNLAHRRFGPAFLHSFLLSYRPGRADPLLFSHCVAPLCNGLSISR